MFEDYNLPHKIELLRLFYTKIATEVEIINEIDEMCMDNDYEIRLKLATEASCELFKILYKETLDNIEVDSDFIDSYETACKLIYEAPLMFPPGIHYCKKDLPFLKEEIERYNSRIEYYLCDYDYNILRNILEEEKHDSTN